MGNTFQDSYGTVRAQFTPNQSTELTADEKTQNREQNLQSDKRGNLKITEAKLPIAPSGDNCFVLVVGANSGTHYSIRDAVHAHVAAAVDAGKMFTITSDMPSSKLYWRVSPLTSGMSISITSVSGSTQCQALADGTSYDCQFPAGTNGIIVSGTVAGYLRGHISSY